MKKTKMLLFFAILLALSFAFLMFLEYNGFKFYTVWFSLSLIFIGFYALIYFVCFKMDSSLYYGVLLLGIGLTGILRKYFALPFKIYYPIYILCFGVASFAVFVFFRQNIHFKIFAILAIEGIILLGYKLNFFNIWSLYAVNGVFLLLVMMDVISRIRKNLRSQK